MQEFDLEIKISVLELDIEEMETELASITDEVTKKTLEDKLELAYNEYDNLMMQFNQYSDYEYAAELDEFVKMSDAYHAYDGGCDI